MLLCSIPRSQNKYFLWRYLNRPPRNLCVKYRIHSSFHMKGRAEQRAAIGGGGQSGQVPDGGRDVLQPAAAADAPRADRQGHQGWREKATGGCN